jgi:hypothetical protein
MPIGMIETAFIGDLQNSRRIVFSVIRMSNLKNPPSRRNKRAAEELGGPLGKARKRRDPASGNPLQRFSYGSGGRLCVTASYVPMRLRLAAIFRRTLTTSAAGPLACLRPSRGDARDAFASHPRGASRCAGPDRRRLALARARAPFGSPNDGAPSGRQATFAAGLQLSRGTMPSCGRVPQDPEVASREVSISPATYPSRAVLVRGGQPSDYPVPAFSPGQLQSPVRAGLAFALTVFPGAVAPSFPSRGWLIFRDVSTSPRGSFVRGSSFTFYALRTRSRSRALSRLGRAPCRPLRHADPATLLGFDQFCLPFAALIRLQPFVAVSAGVDPFPGYGPTCR